MYFLQPGEISASNSNNESIVVGNVASSCMLSIHRVLRALTTPRYVTQLGCESGRYTVYATLLVKTPKSVLQKYPEQCLSAI